MEKDIILAARKWIGTPFKHQGRLLGVGCDCLGLLMGIAKECSLVTLNNQPLLDLDQSTYHMVSDGNLLEHLLGIHLKTIPKITLASLVLLEFDKNPQHLGIITDNSYNTFNIIHADISRGGVVEHILTEEYEKKIKKIHKLNVEDKENLWPQ